MEKVRLLNSVVALSLSVVVSQPAFAESRAASGGSDARAGVIKLWDADANKDGRLSKSEVASLPGLARHFDRIDSDHDGNLTREELRGARERMLRMQKEHFGALRDLESESHQARINILQQAEACIKAAATPEIYRRCEQQEQAARSGLRATMQSKRDALLAEARK